MPTQGSAGPRIRIPAAIAAATTATIERASRLLHEASRAIQTRAKAGWPGGGPKSPRRGPASNERSGGDDTH